MGFLSSPTQTHCCSLLLSIAILFTFKGISSVTATTFTFTNKCSYTVWPGILSGSGTPNLASTGFQLDPSSTRSIPAPPGWSGRFWGRTGCNFDASGHGSCSTGDCGSGQVECNGAGAQPPATLAEFTLNGANGQDFYDVSLVDGYNVPMFVEASGGSGGCGSTGCLVDLNTRCPAELKAEGGGACRSACEAFGSPKYCCSGDFNSPGACKPTPYSQLFKTACPRSYSYAYDDATSTFTCSAADYTVTFCGPSSTSQKSSMGMASSASGSDSGSESGSDMAAGAVIANGSWLGNLASGDSAPTRGGWSPWLQPVLLFITISQLLHLSLWRF